MRKRAKNSGTAFFDLGVLTLRSGEKLDPLPSRARHHSGGDRRSDGIDAQVLSTKAQIDAVEAL